MPDSPVIRRPKEESENVNGTVPELTMEILISSPFLKSNFSVTIERDGPSTKTNWFVFFTSIKKIPVTSPAITPTTVNAINVLEDKY